ncbi:hypothetical protein B5F74_11730 [Collinsella sp. An271]|uniref:S-layer homology domain-containing protein n=1 Tax=Collinsella sp. An271 TaxID=1965616 RepID=UPI000B37F9D9|nr:S-layer homology domain-containing protein [Collinsella sp. An271]OUO57790.1 hypothetical protein B5F74_11730 [Collinsella sp. An271]
MTACVNRKHTKKVAAVVTASLVGALSLGVAPVAAMADTGIETLALSAGEAFKQGAMTEATDGEGRNLEIPADGIITVEAGKWVVPTEITPKDSDPVEVIDWVASGEDSSIQNAEITYTLPDGTTKAHSAVSDADFMAPGRYTANVKMIKGDYNGSSISVTFIVEAPADLSNATVFDASNGSKNVSDTTFTFNGQNQVLGVAVDGKVVDPSKYSIQIDKRLNANGGQDVQNNVAAYDAGTYIANIKDTTGTVKAKVTFTVGRLNLSDADVAVADIKKTDVTTTIATVDEVSVDGVKFTTASGLVSTLVDATSGQTGKSTVIVTPGSSANGNVIGSASAELNVVEKVVKTSDVYYNGNPVPATVPVNLADGQSFMANRIEVKDPISRENINSAYFTVTYKDANGKDVDVAALSNPGVYTATVEVNAEASHFEYGCEVINFKINVQSAQIEDGDSIVFKYDGKIGNNFQDTYTGEDFLPQIETIVHTKWGDDLVAGTDYTVQAYNADGDKVDQIVDAGKYEVKIELKGNYGSSITSADLKCDFEVTALNLSYGLYVNGGDLTSYTWDTGTDGIADKTVWYLSYTGEDLEPSFELGYYTDSDGKVVEYHSDIANKLTWHALPTEAVTVTGYRYDGKPVDALNAKGEYTVEFALENDNYVIRPAAGTGVKKNATTNVITVSESNVAFADVDPNEWYAKSVFEAKQLGYIKGIQGSNLYAPNAAISRADALVIISRMAGADVSYGEDWLSQNIGYVTRYSDVDENAYYAKAIAWATKVGIVHGYGDGTFAPTKQITREEFATMLANYAKAAGNFDAADGSALDGMSDAASVSDWAEESVAWAVENGVMGNGGFIAAQSDITRAEVAAMAVNYQPDGISSDVIG